MKKRSLNDKVQRRRFNVCQCVQFHYLYNSLTFEKGSLIGTNKTVDFFSEANSHFLPLGAGLCPLCEGGSRCFCWNRSDRVPGSRRNYRRNLDYGHKVVIRPFQVHLRPRQVNKRPFSSIIRPYQIIRGISRAIQDLFRSIRGLLRSIWGFCRSIWDLIRAIRGHFKSIYEVYSVPYEAH